jgi:hypothetical protein
MNLIGAEGWIIDTFRYSGTNLPSRIDAFVTGVDGVGRVGDYSVQVIRRKTNRR